METLGTKIKAARKKADMAMAKLSTAIGKSHGYINAIEHDTFIPSEEVVLRLGELMPELQADLALINRPKKGRPPGVQSVNAKSKPGLSVAVRRALQIIHDEGPARAREAMELAIKLHESEGSQSPEPDASPCATPPNGEPKDR